MKIFLDKIKMNVIETAPNGVVNEQTIFTFFQNEEYVSADYSGGQIVMGHLVGYIDDGKLFFSFCQLQTDGKINNGQSICDIAISEKGKIRLIEHFKWTSKKDEPGINIFQEL